MNVAGRDIYFALLVVAAVLALLAFIGSGDPAWLAVALLLTHTGMRDDC